MAKTRNVCVALVCPAKRRSMVPQSTDFRCERTRRLPLRTDTRKTVCSAKAGHKKAVGFLSERHSDVVFSALTPLDLPITVVTWRRQILVAAG